MDFLWGFEEEGREVHIHLAEAGRLHLDNFE